MLPRAADPPGEDCRCATNPTPQGSHHGVATCVDCHLPHGFAGKWLAKGANGFNHSKAFTLQDFDEPIGIKPLNGRILQRSCLRCHADLVDHLVGWQEGDAEAVHCVHCHRSVGHGETLGLGGMHEGIRRLAASSAAVPHLPSIARWRAGGRQQPYDPNRDATRTELRSYVCGQCHVEYYCSSQLPLTFPWGQGLRVGQVERFWDETKLPDGTRFFDYQHAETGAAILKAQHPEFELWSQGIHARSNVACADCHMPYMRDGAAKVSDHWVRSPLLNINRACQTCHKLSESEIKARVEAIQERNYELMQHAGAAVVNLLDAILAVKQEGATPEQLKDALELQRKAQWRLDFIAAENSMGFHAPQEAALALGEALDYARRGEVAALRWRSPVKAPAAVPASAPAPKTPAPAAPPATKAAAPGP
ncbi:MAG: ammonia-forming cytochrome c nitrite reductase subunit c552 [Deltaproteobacteria bacterium]|nr:ammonia-forming cytochrome c nitrite reductase subunit c552 [Deltaproteobacteria bacterium]